jgi:hypothetical protein
VRCSCIGVGEGGRGHGEVEGRHVAFPRNNIQLHIRLHTENVRKFTNNTIIFLLLLHNPESFLSKGKNYWKTAKNLGINQGNVFCEFCGHKPFYSISVSGAFLGTSLPPIPSWSRFDLYMYVYSFVNQGNVRVCCRKKEPSEYDASHQD